MKIFVRIFGFLLWVTAIGLTIALVQEFTSDDQNIVVTGISFLAIAISAIGLAFARYAWTKRAYPEIALGIAMWTAGFVSLAFLEVSYWASSYNDRYEAYSLEKKTKERQNARGDKAWDALMSGNLPASVAQLEAQIKSKQLDPAIVGSDGCQDPRSPRARKACQEVHDLEATLAQAKEREKLESESLASAVPSAKHHLANNVFAFAEIVAKLTHGDVKTWSYVIMFWNWILLALIRDAGLLVMNPLGRSQAKKEEPPVILPSEKVGQPASSTRPRKQYEPWINLFPDHQPPAIKTPAEALSEAWRAVGADMKKTLTEVDEVFREASKNSKPEDHSSVLPSKPEESTLKQLLQVATPDRDGSKPVENVHHEHTNADISEPVFSPVVASSATTENLVAFPGVDLAAAHRAEKDKRATKMALAKKKAVTPKSDLHKTILRWSIECGSRVPVINGKDPGAPSAVESYQESFVPWCNIYGHQVAGKRLFSRIMADELDLPHSKAPGRSAGSRKLLGFRHAIPAPKRATA